MIEKLTYITTDETNPYKNLALEEYLLKNTNPDEVILYLWQNEKTVVIGKNQNCYGECRVSALEQDNGRVARRLSGGGAVFHDLGNLNFTFLAREQNYNVDRQLEVILKAVNSFFIAAKKTGRNDISVDGAKFSGNAFYKNGDFCYHHGTILIDVDMEKLSKYLNVSEQKLKSNSVSSVKSRVVNLKSLNEKITIESMKKALIQGFGEVYNQKPTEFLKNRLDHAEISALTEKYSSWEFVFGRSIRFSHAIKKRFDWGDIELQLEVASGKIIAANAFSDSMDYEFAEQLVSAVVGAKYSPKELAKAIFGIKTQSIQAEQMSTDITNLILEDLT